MASNHVAYISAGGTTATVAHSLYGYCTTGASTVAKTVTMYKMGKTTGAAWAAGDLVDGLTITVRFQYANTATNPTLNVGSTGAKPIYKYGTTAATTWPAQSILQLTYDTQLNSNGCWVINSVMAEPVGTTTGSVNSTTLTTTATTVVTGVTTAAQTVATGGSTTTVKTVNTAASQVVTGVTTASQTVITGTSVANEIMSFTTASIGKTTAVNTASLVTVTPYTTISTTSINKVTAVNTGSVNSTTGTTTAVTVVTGVS